MTPNGEFNGFGRDLFIKESGLSSSYVGWWKNNMYHGNGIETDYFHGNEIEIQEEEIQAEGWFDNHKLIEGYKEDVVDEGKYFEKKEILG